MIPLQDDNPSTIRPLFTIAFVVLCVLVFLWQFPLGPEGGGGVAFRAHIGGFVAGMALIPFLRKKGFSLFRPQRY